MPRLNNARNELFAQGIAKGMNQTAAARHAGYSESHCGVTGSRLAKHLNIKARVEEIQNKMEQRTIATVSVSIEWVIQGLIQNIEDAREEKQFGVVRQCFVDIGKHLGGFIDRVDSTIQYPEDISSLNDKQRTTVMRWLARMAYPDDPAAAEAALQLPSGTEVIEGKAEVNETKKEEETSQEVFSGAGDEFQGSQSIPSMGRETPIHARSWADIEPEERQALVAEWKEKVPGPPLFITKEQRLKWMNENWPLEQGLVESGAHEQVAEPWELITDNEAIEPLSRSRSWSDITDPEERRKLAAEWSIRGPQMPELPKEERVAWLDANWPLRSRLDW